MRVVVYEPDYNPEHRKVLRAFAEGAGAEVRDARSYVDCDVAVIFGGAKNSFSKTLPKAEIMKRHSGSRLIMIESAFIDRKRYWQVGYGGSSGHADFRNKNSPGDRWDAMDVPYKSWRYQPEGYIVVCGQVPWDTQVQDTDHALWCRKTMAFFSERRVWFRPHPRTRTDHRAKYLIHWSLYSPINFEECCAQAKCFVTWNSTVAVDALLQGVPVIALDSGSIAWDMAGHSLKDVNDLVYPDRTQWLHDLAYAQWTLEEMRSGLVWRHLNI